MAELRATAGQMCRITLLDPTARQVIEQSVAGGVGSNRHQRKVLPSEGTVFLRAVLEMLAHSTQWRAVDETPRTVAGRRAAATL